MPRDPILSITKPHRNFQLSFAALREICAVAVPPPHPEKVTCYGAATQLNLPHLQELSLEGTGGWWEDLEGTPATLSWKGTFTELCLGRDTSVQLFPWGPHD